MGAFVTAFNAVLPLFLIIFAGVFFSRTKGASEIWVDILNKYALKVGLPALVIASLMRIENGLAEYTGLILANSVYFVVSMLLAFPVAKALRLSHQVKRALLLVLSYGNVAYLGIPVLTGTYGDAALPVAAVISAVYIFWLLTLGIAIIEFTGENNPGVAAMLTSWLKNPLLWSVFAGILIAVFQVKLPAFAEKTIHLISGSVTAVVLFSLGIFLGFHQSGRIRDWGRAFAWSLVIMIILPFFLYLVLSNTMLTSFHLRATVLEAAMPLGLTSYALAVQYKLETPLVARIVVLSTLLSLVSVPLWIAFLG